MSITDKATWWWAVDNNWADLKAIVQRFCPEELSKAEKLCKARDGSLGAVFELAWFNAPDVPQIHEIPGWGVLCDLCSERDVLS